MAITNAQLNEKLDEVLDEVKANRRDIGTISVAITGSVDGNVKGINQHLRETHSRIDLLEVAETTRRKWIGAAVFSAVSGLLGIAWTAIKGALAIKGGSGG